MPQIGNLISTRTLTWATAANDVQNAIDSAYSEVLTNTEVNVCEVWVTQGTYYIYKSADADTVQLQPGVEVYGGFSGDGTETERDQRDWETNETVLNGHQSGSSSERVTHVVLGADFALLDGFTVTGGYANNTSGAGMLNSGVSPTVRHCYFVGNDAPGSSAYGGAIHSSNGYPRIDRCVFQDNTSGTAGGAIRQSYAGALISNCLFINNTAGTNAGGGYSGSWAWTTIINSTFWGNSAGQNGRAVNTYHGLTWVMNNIFWNNPGDDIFGTYGGLSVTTYSIVEGGQSGTGNLTDNPLFIDSASYDFHLQAGSPAIDSCNGCGAPARDLDYDPRVDDSAETNDGVGPPWVDRGPFERQGSGFEEAIWSFDLCCNPPQTYSGNGHDYWYCESSLAWQYAGDRCRELGTHLATIEDTAENAFVQSLILENVWIGGNDIQVEDTWKWSNGETWSFTNWATDEPNDTNQEDCTVLSTTDGLWNDNHCGYPQSAFVCESF